MARMPASDIAKILRREKALWASVLSAVVFAVHGDHWFDDLSHFVTVSSNTIFRERTLFSP